MQKCNPVCINWVKKERKMDPESNRTFIHTIKLWRFTQVEKNVSLNMKTHPVHFNRITIMTQQRCLWVLALLLTPTNTQKASSVAQWFSTGDPFSVGGSGHVRFIKVRTEGLVRSDCNGEGEGRLYCTWATCACFGREDGGLKVLLIEKVRAIHWKRYGTPPPHGQPDRPHHSPLRKCVACH